MKMSRAGVTFAVFLGALAALPPIAIDMALPALTRIGDALQSTQSLAGMTLSLFMAGVGRCWWSAWCCSRWAGCWRRWRRT
jgi:DHA1 family bicyclomycin/chloramphenicol resistance-like MFS transporter